MSFRIPCTQPGRSSWTQTTALEGRDYQLGFDWFQRDARWRFSIADVQGSPIRSGLVLTTGTSLLAGVRDPRRPPGALVVVDLTGANDLDPGFNDLGVRFVLAYFTAAELA